MKQWISAVLLMTLLSGCQPAKEMPVAMTLRNMQVLYAGLANPVKYVVNGVACKDLILTCEKGRATIQKQEDCSFLITPLGVWEGELTVFCYKKKVHKEHLLQRQVLRVLPIPQPVASLNGNTGSSISKGTLMALKQVSVTLENFVFEGVRYRASSFEYVVVQGKTKRVLLRGEQKGHAIPHEFRALFPDLEKGDLIHIFNIRARPNVKGLEEVPVQNNLSMVLR